MTKNTATRFAIGISAILTGSAAMAQDQAPTEVEFGYRAIELATPAAEAKLEKRIDRFVTRNCRSSSPLVSKRSENSCRAEMREELIAKIYSGTALAKR